MDRDYEAVAMNRVALTWNMSHLTLRNGADIDAFIDFLYVISHNDISYTNVLSLFNSLNALYFQGTDIRNSLNNINRGNYSFKYILMY